MKYLTRLALASAAALLLVAALGAGTATAGTTLCKANETPCGAGNALTAGSELKFRSTGLIIIFSVGGEGCTEPTFTAKLSNSGGKEENIKGTLENWNFATCECSTKMLKPGTFTLESTAETMNGKFSISEVEFEISCGVSPRCLFRGNFSPAPVLEGGKPAFLSMKLNEVPLQKIIAGTCKFTSVWEGRWEVTNFTSLWVSNG